MIDNSILKAKAFIRQMNMLCGPMRLDAFIHSREDFLDLLLSKSVTDINRYLKLYFVRTLGSCQAIRCINPSSLYIVFENRRVGCFLGSDFLSPQIRIPTLHQLHEEFNWIRKSKEKPPTPFAFDYLDDLFQERVNNSVCIIENLQTILQNGVTPWDYVIRSQEGCEIQRVLLNRLKYVLLEIRDDISTLKDLKAPHFIQEGCCRDLERVKIISKRLSKTTHS